MTTSPSTPLLSGSDSLQAYDRHVDGLFTYCLSVLCRHEAAVAAVVELRDLALRHGGRLAEPELRRAWLYALARHCCLRRLEQGLSGPADSALGLDRARIERQRRELALLAWPEAAGTEPEQREVLELASRHGLDAVEVAAVLGLELPAAERLLAEGAAEVRRTRAVLLTLAAGGCPELARLGGAGGSDGRVLGPALRRELVQHVADCPTCRGTAERVSGAPGAERTGLAVLPAPAELRISAGPGWAPDGEAGGDGGARAARPAGAARVAGAAFFAGAAAGRRAASHAVSRASDELRFDQRGFPRHRAGGGRALAVRQRLVTTGVLAAVLTAPVVALWGAQRGDAGATAPVSSVRLNNAGPSAVQDVPEPTGGPERAHRGARGPAAPGAAMAAGRSAATAGRPASGGTDAETLLHGRVASPSPTTGTGAPSAPASAPAADPTAAGVLTVEASEYGSRTVLTLTNSGGRPITWHAAMDVDWLRLSRDSGTLAPGQRITVTVTVDEQRAPQGHWTARIALPPSEAVVTLEGGPTHRDGDTPTAPATPSPTATPSTAPTGQPAPTRQPTPTAKG